MPEFIEEIAVEAMAGALAIGAGVALALIGVAAVWAAADWLSDRPSRGSVRPRGGGTEGGSSGGAK